MANGYWVALAGVHDSEGYKDCVAQNAVASDSRYEASEGRSRSRVAVISRQTFEASRTCAHRVSECIFDRPHLCTSYCSTSSRRTFRRARVGRHLSMAAPGVWL